MHPYPHFHSSVGFILYFAFCFSIFFCVNFARQAACEISFACQKWIIYILRARFLVMGRAKVPAKLSYNKQFAFRGEALQCRCATVSTNGWMQTVYIRAQARRFYSMNVLHVPYPHNRPTSPGPSMYSTWRVAAVHSGEAIQWRDESTEFKKWICKGKWMEGASECFAAEPKQTHWTANVGWRALKASISVVDNRLRCTTLTLVWLRNVIAFQADSPHSLCTDTLCVISFLFL